MSYERPMQTDALGLTCCVRLHETTTMLALVGTCCVQFETGQTFGATSPNISIVLWPAKRSTTMLASWKRPCMRIAIFFQDYCTRMHCFIRQPPTMLAIAAFVCMHQATSANNYHIVGLTMLWLVASVCMGLSHKKGKLHAENLKEIQDDCQV